MKKRFAEHGFQGMEQHEIVELLLYYAIPRKDTNPLAHRLIDRYGSLSKVCDAPFELLCEDFGLTESAALLLKMVPELAKAYTVSRQNLHYIDNRRVVELFRPQFFGATVEKLAIALTDAEDNLLLCDVIFEGSVSVSQVPMRKIAGLALRHNAKYVYLAHNHPSGLCVPSRQDLEATHLISQTLTGIGVMLVDHLVFTADKYFSIRSHPQFSKSFVK